MNKNLEKLVNAMPKVSVKKEDIPKVIKEQKEIMTQARSYVNSLSITRHMNIDFIDSFSFDQKLNIFDTMMMYDFVLEINELYFQPNFEDLEYFIEQWNNDFGIKYIESLVYEGFDLLDDLAYTDEDGLDHLYGEVFQRELLLYSSSVGFGDNPPVLLLLSAQRAMIAYEMITLNLDALSQANSDIEIVEVLPTLA